VIRDDSAKERADQTAKTDDQKQKPALASGLCIRTGLGAQTKEREQLLAGYFIVVSENLTDTRFIVRSA
jgi:hypothetical protein